MWLKAIKKADCYLLKECYGKYRPEQTLLHLGQYGIGYGPLPSVPGSRGDESYPSFILGCHECVWQCVQENEVCKKVSTFTITLTITLTLLFMAVFHRLYNRFWQFGGLNLVREYIRLGVFGEFLKQGLLVLLRRKTINAGYSCIQQKVVPRIRKKYAPLLQELIKTYSDKELTHEHCRKVWVCWFQGMEEAPEIVRICHTSLHHYVKNREIVLLTDENINQYVTFPEHIRNKYQNGEITMAHYSDLLRLEVLTRYGGTWIDATVLCTGSNYPQVIFDTDLFFFQYIREGDAYFRGISNWFISASSNQKALLVLKEMLYQYHKDYNCAVDYFIFHIFFMMIAKKMPEEVIRMPRVSNRYCFVLENHLGDTYDEAWMNALIANCCFHKLNGRLWKEAEGKKDTNLCKIKEMFDDDNE